MATAHRLALISKFGGLDSPIEKYKISREFERCGLPCVDSISLLRNASRLTISNRLTVLIRHKETGPTHSSEWRCEGKSPLRMVDRIRVSR